MKVIITGATGMVGEGVLLECLDNPLVERVLTVARRSSGHTHAKLSELVVPDFRELSSVETQLTGYDACFYCAGVSSVGLTEPEYTAITYDTPLHFAETLLRLNPTLVLVHVSGAHSDGTEQGKVMWARVKGKAENALARLPFKAVYNFRPSLMKPTPGQLHIKGLYRALLVFYPLLNLFFPGLPLGAVARAMINAVRFTPPKTVLEAADIKELADTAARV
ncbi:MAG: NAD-dependent epimerase/dehydratase family protein [Polyangiaceae bacterium]